MAETHAAEAHSSPSEALLFVLTCILIGVATKFFLGRVKVPYTALLLVIGLCIGLLQAAAPKTEAFTATLEMWMDIDPHLLLLIFLPTIGFSAALSQEPHLLRRNWGQILILAWPGVVVTFVLIGLCGRYFFPYGWTWAQCLLFGAMLSATDPVAVVAVLHEVGADEKLSSVIDGESLVNDGSALVIFLVLQQFVQGASLTASEIVKSFVHLALLGAVLGLGFGLVTSLWLANIWNDPCLEIVLTLGAAYGCYFVAEELAGASGLLAVVVMGFSMSLLGGRQIMNRIKTEMHAFWNVMEWLANTILFVWVGIALAFVLLEPSNPQLQAEVKFSHYLSPVDAGYAVVLYLWLLVARACAIFLFYPLLSSGRVGYPMTWRTALFMVWAGLRGAVGVAMSLFILLDPLIVENEFKAHCVFFMSTMAFATVVINGTTAKYVLEGLGLLKMTQQQLDVLQYVLKEVDGVTGVTLDSTRPDDVLGCPDPALVKRWSALQAARVLTPKHDKTLRRLLALQSARQGATGSRTHAAVSAALEECSDDRKLREYRARLLSVVKASYGDMYQHFEVTTPGIRLLQEVTDKALDAATGGAAAAAAAARRLNSRRSSSGSNKQYSGRGMAVSPAGYASGNRRSGTAEAAGAAGAPAGVIDPETGTVQQQQQQDGEGCLDGLIDWSELEVKLQEKTWSGWFSSAAGSCGLKTLQEALSQREVASKLQLVSAFVAAHSTAQEVFSAHFAEPGPPSHTGGQDAAAAASSTSTQDPSTAADASTANSAASGRHNSKAHNSSSSKYADTSSSGDQPSTGVEGKGFPPKSGADDDTDMQLAHRVVQESRAEADAALQYAHNVLMPMHPGLGRLLMSRHVAIQVLERQKAFLSGIEDSGLVRAEEMHKVQHKAAVRLERLQHQRTWNIINLEHQQAAHLGAAATNEGKTPLAPAAAAAAGATGEGNASDAAAAVLDGTQSVTAATAGGARGGGLQQRRRQQQQEPGAVSVGAAGEGAVGLSQQHQPGVLLGDMHQVSYSLQQRANRPK